MNSALGDYEERTISEASLQRLLQDGKMYGFENTFFDEINLTINLPYGYKLIKTRA